MFKGDFTDDVHSERDSRSRSKDSTARKLVYLKS